MSTQIPLHKTSKYSLWVLQSKHLWRIHWITMYFKDQLHMKVEHWCNLVFYTRSTITVISGRVERWKTISTVQSHIKIINKNWIISAHNRSSMSVQDLASEEAYTSRHKILQLPQNHLIPVWTCRHWPRPGMLGMLGSQQAGLEDREYPSTEASPSGWQIHGSGRPLNCC